jgi:hypothetical protein
LKKSREKKCERKTKKKEEEEDYFLYTTEPCLFPSARSSFWDSGLEERERGVGREEDDSFECK